MFATNAGTFMIDLFAIWQAAFAREWEDLGELIRRREAREHIGLHRITFIEGGSEACACFECRVERAWVRAHAFPRQPNHKQRRHERMLRKQRRGWA